MLAKPPDKPTAPSIASADLGAVRRLISSLARQLAYQARVPLIADDLTQIGLEAAWKLTRDYDPARGPFSTFVYPRVRGAMLDALEGECRRPLPVDWERLDATPVDEPSPEEQLAAAREYAVLTAHVQAWLRELAPLDRMLVEVCVMDDYTIAEASEMLEVGYEWARWRLKRVRQTYRQKKRP
ncbi:MAG: RNA polymerase sigma factor [Polyangiaceae bacterium]